MVANLPKLFNKKQTFFIVFFLKQTYMIEKY